MIKHPYKYKAFISYSRENKKFAYDLHDGLPKLKIPKESQELAKIFNKEINRNRLFIDQKAVGGGVDLGEILTKALLESEFLIVLCTPEVAGSEWMDKEIQFFKRNRDPKKIIVCVYSGRPDWNAATEIGGQCFPKALRYQIDEEGEITSHLEKEPAWVDFRKKSGEGRKTAMARIACGLLGVEPKEVVDFQKLRERRIWQTWITFAVGLALVFAGISYFANYQRKLAEENAKIASENQRLAEKNNSLSTAQLGLREASQGRIRSALQKGLQAYKKDQNLVTKTSLWDSLTSLVREEVADFRQPLYGRGLHLIKDGQLIVVAEKKVAVRDKDGRIHWGNHGAGLSLSSALASDSGSLFILGQGQGRLERWDVQSRQSILLHEHGQSCSWMAKARDRDRLVMGCQDGQIFVYDAASDNTLRQVWQSNKRPNESTAEASIGISNDGSMIFWTYGSGIMRGWNIEEDRMAWEGAVQANPAEFQVSHDGKWSVWYSQDGQMGIFNIKNGQPLGYRRVDGAIQALSISPHDDRVALAVKWPPEANRNPGILELDLASGRDTMVYEAPEYFTQVAYSPAGEIYGLIVKGAIYKMIPSQERSFIPTENSVLKLWPGDAVKKGWFTLVCGKQQDSTERVSLGKSARLSAFVAPIPMVDADFQCLVQGSGQLHWFSDDFSRSETVPGSEEATTAAKLSNGQFLVGTRDGQVLLVTPGQSGKSQQLLSKPLGKPIHFISALQDDFIVLSQGLNEQANGIYQLGPLGLSPHFLFQENFNSGRWRSLGEITNSFSLPEVGRVLLVSNLNRHVNENGELIQFDLKSKEIVASLPFKGGMVRDIVYLPKKNRLALATGNGRIALLNPQTWKMETELVNGDVPVTTLLTWEQDGATILLAGDNQGTLTLRNLDDEKEQYRTFPLPGSIISQSYQQETDLLALGSPQGITVWQGLKRPRFLEKSPGYPWLESQYVPDLINQSAHLEASEKIPLLHEILRLLPWDGSLRTLLSKALIATGDFTGGLAQEDLSLGYATTLFDPVKDATSLRGVKFGSTTTKFNIYLDWWKRQGNPQALINGIQLVLEGLRENPQESLLHFQFQIGLLAAGQFDTLLSWLPQSLSIQGQLGQGIPSPKTLEKFGIWSAFMLDHPELVTRDMVQRAYDPSDPNFTPGKGIIRQLLLEPDNITYNVTEVEKEERETADAEMTNIHFLTGLAHHRHGRKDKALSEFRKGEARGDSFGLNRQAIQRMEKKLEPVAMPKEMIDEYQRILNDLSQPKPATATTP